MRHRRITLALAGLIALGAAGPLAASAQAATITVNSLNDSGGSGCELREAIISANNDNAGGNGCANGSGADTINVTVPGTISFSGITQPVTSNETIVGLGVGSTSITHAPVGRVLDVGASGALTLRSLRVTGGAGILSGAGIRNAGTLVLGGVQVDHNTAVGVDGGGIEGLASSSTTIIGSEIGPGNVAGGGGGPATGGDGGGIFIEQGALTIQASTVHDNSALNAGSAGGEGAGIYAFGSGLGATAVNVQSSTLSGNVADLNGGGLREIGDGTVQVTDSVVSGNKALNVPMTGSDGVGGGILLTIPTSAEIVRSVLAGNQAERGGGLFSNVLSPGSLLISRTTVSGNSAQAGGGALLYNNSTVVNSTVSGNSATGFGGGITASLSNPGDETAISYSTIAGNVAGPGNGGGINVDGAVVKLGHSVLANPTGGDCFTPPAIVSQGFNVVSDSSCDGVSVAAGDRPGTDPKLGSLADNGGPGAGVGLLIPIRTRALMLGSRALDFGAASCAIPGVDQRGFPRPFASGCDAGAFEYTDSDGDGIENGVDPTPFGVQPHPPSPSNPSSPSNRFTFGKVTRNKKKGIAFVFVDLPGPGEVGLRGKGLKTIDLAAAGGTVKLKVAPAKKGKKARKVRRALLHKGKAKVKALVSYLPAGGVANTEGVKVKLLRR